MASEFIGFTIFVALKGPPPEQKLRGVVADVADQKLFLKDVTLLSTGQYLHSYQIDSSTIADLEIVPSQRSGPPATTYHNPIHQEIVRRATQPVPEHGPPKQLPPPPLPPPFADPAILSFTKPLSNNKSALSERYGSRHSQPGTGSPVMIADSVTQSPMTLDHHQTGHQYQPRPSDTMLSAAAATVATTEPEAASQTPKDRRDSSATATLTKPFDHLALNEADAHMAGNTFEPAPSPSGAHRKSKGRTERKGKENQSQATVSLSNPAGEQSVQTAVQKQGLKGKGWRQTPLVEEASPAKARSRRRRPRPGAQRPFVEDTNGWATEDATDIHDLGEFDFEHNLSKFDKRRVFDDIGRDDKVADDHRLVSLNRKSRPGTNGGRNLHYAENVLDIPDTKASPWRDDTGESDEDELLREQYSSGRNSRRDASQRPPPPPPPTQNATFQTTKQSAKASSLNGPVSSSRAALRLASTSKPCTCVTPLQMLEIEQLCTSELGLSDEILHENAGRGIAEAALTLPSDLPVQPTVLILMGNHKSGCRAIAAARHLRNHNVRVSICILGGEREHLLLESLKRQLDMYRKSGGWLVRWDEFQSKLSSTTASSSAPATTASPSEGPVPDLIIDALLGTHVTFSELRTDDQAIAFEMIRWASRCSKPILSVDVPSGLHASSGHVTVVDSSPLIIHAAQIVCIGAPKSGLLTALASGEGRSRDWSLSVVDMGISNVAWRKYGTRRRHGVDFGTHWLVPLKFVGAGAGAGDGTAQSE